MLGSLADKSSEFLRSLPGAWRLLGPEQRVAAVGSLLLIVSTFGSFTFVEAAQVLTALGVLLLLKKRTDGSVFHLPFGDGTAIAAAGLWCGLLILVRLFDRPLGQNLLALACAALMLGAGMRERAKRPMDDLPPETVDRRARRPDVQADWLAEDEERTERIPRDGETTERLSGPRDPGSGPGPAQR
ncbi:MAG TPA: hypothetical protein VH247_02920 [Thermoleophilaceae bacterium]|nr:hypothetical protein [Thermoleophilaceae bacterium]